MWHPDVQSRCDTKTNKSSIYLCHSFYSLIIYSIFYNPDIKKKMCITFFVHLALFLQRHTGHIIQLSLMLNDLNLFQCLKIISAVNQWNIQTDVWTTNILTYQTSSMTTEWSISVLRVTRGRTEAQYPSVREDAGHLYTWHVKVRSVRLSEVIFHLYLYRSFSVSVFRMR